MTNVAAFVIKLIISLVIFLSFIVGFHRHVVPVQENACHMTYMFEYPQYIVSNRDFFHVENHYFIY